ncbi:MAG: hypothetical protein A3F33_00120 [Candidatus Woykebacteria bacterium RIFCSPHIGHO2_12_FULL_43_10]|uniref:Uncharacterized protein n=2 Tax=Candidatus Woykeibacteriota TaxID=1817899 RepID=A0A1G1WVS2_9BACT|nr:MAG: hypothetical protein A2802_01750 [Candidatus Woykebacteria bacterium RIFCSPHIGHO2_01_FULL_43_29]OGY29688.1 MAG: hypothetical protein A3J50_04480 [Candidatus Woykebacteria bacterium RIFCSPHIGHO2_02_FULL_43_16b]OGY30400.1 MAG: hypothetical protein A3F33_00120 [Candidatus Woykebacteria bacterium RIFCSPHIGHO2_12_FULL_43_10]OGY31849.1 MAG: hypothetical protein A3A61_02965 [Candidatus Woykebacteria bacterium RIFCSPLOWO2_01_FULL_43_14]
MSQTPVITQSFVSFGNITGRVWQDYFYPKSLLMSFSKKYLGWQGKIPLNLGGDEIEIIYLPSQEPNAKFRFQNTTQKLFSAWINFTLSPFGTIIHFYTDETFFRFAFQRSRFSVITLEVGPLPIRVSLN